MSNGLFIRMGNLFDFGQIDQLTDLILYQLEKGEQV